MRWRRSSAVVLRQFYLMRGSVSRLVPLFAWVTIDVVLWGFITRYFSSIAGPGFAGLRLLLGAVLMWDFFTRVMQGVTTTFFEDVWARNFLNLFAAPITIGEYIAGLVVSAIAMSLIGLVVMIVLAAVAFGLSFAAYGLVVVPFLLVLFVFGIGLGLLACAVVLRLGPSSEWFVWPIPVLLSPVVGVFYPLATLPAWLRAIARGLRRRTCSRACARWSPGTARRAAGSRSRRRSPSSSSCSPAGCSPARTAGRSPPG